MHLRDDRLIQFLYFQQRDRIEAAVLELPEYERLVLALYYCERIDLTGIAFAIGESYARACDVYDSRLSNFTLTTWRSRCMATCHPDERETADKRPQGSHK